MKRGELLHERKIFFGTFVPGFAGVVLVIFICILPSHTSIRARLKESVRKVDLEVRILNLLLIMAVADTIGTRPVVSAKNHIESEAFIR